MSGGRTLTEGPVGRALLALAGPMAIGIASVMAFNLIDTWFVSQLGTEALAAISFTFPVVMIVGSIALGIGVGTTSVVARAIGHGDDEQVRTLATGAISLGVVIVATVTASLYFSLEPLFVALGAQGEVLALVLSYMRLWTFGIVFLVVPMVGNAIIRAGGDTKTPAKIMVFAGGINGVLDPILIFGFGPVPAMGIEGAAIATVIGRAFTLVLALYVLVVRERILTWRLTLAGLVGAWRRVLAIALPAAGGQLAAPLSAGLLTALVAGYGAEVVAAYGAGTRVQMFALLPLMALSSGLAPFIGQNVGAERHDRVGQALRIAVRASVLIGAALFVLLAVLAGPVADAFTDDPAVQPWVALYLVVVPMGFALFGVLQTSISTFNAMGKPLRATALTVLRAPLAAVGLAYALGESLGVVGVFAAVALADVLVGGLAVLMIWPHLKASNVDAQEAVQPPLPSPA
jgi:putative MATE family efflux protein